MPNPVSLGFDLQRWPRTVPIAVVALIVSLYWWRVLRMAYKMRRKTGRAANLVPSESLGRILRIVWQPVVWIWIGVPWWAVITTPRVWILRSLNPPLPLLWASMCVAGCAYVGSRVCWKRMGRSWRMGIDPMERTELVFNGPFAYVRHPIYALSSALMIATVIAVPNPLMFFAAVVHLVLLQWEARREERYLCTLHGSAYRAYQQHVGRFLPTLFRSIRNDGLAP